MSKPENETGKPEDEAQTNAAETAGEAGTEGAEKEKEEGTEDPKKEEEGDDSKTDGGDKAA